MTEHRAADKAHTVVDQVEGLVDEHTAPEHPRRYAESDAPATSADLVREQRLETDDAFGPVTKAQVHGVITGGILGGLLGAAVSWPLGFISWGGVALGVRMLAMAAIGAFAFAVGFVVYLGGRLPELEGETTGGDNKPMDGTSPRDPGTDDRGRPSGATGPV